MRQLYYIYVWLYCLCSVLIPGESINMVDAYQSNNPNHLDTTCRFTVKTESGRYFTKWLNILQAIQANLNLSFIDNTTHKNVQYTATDDTILPTQWMWTYVPPGGAYFYVSWPVEYSIYSFGLLNSRSLDKVVRIDLMASPPNCSILVGDSKTTQNIAYALYKMSRDFMYPKKSDKTVTSPYQYSYWCFITKFANYNNSLLKDWKIYIGIPIDLFGYKCCRNNNNNNTVDCHINQDRRWNSLFLVPVIIALVFFGYFPILLMKGTTRAVEAGGNIDQNGIDHSNWLFLKKRSPVSVSQLLLGLFKLADTHPVAASRLRRILYVLLSPICVYISLIIYYLKWKAMITELVKNNIPFGFESLIGGFCESVHLFLPLFGGPIISLFLFYASGLLVLLVPRNLATVFELGLPKDESRYCTPLNFDVKTIEKCSHKQCLNFHGYKKTFAVCRGSVYMLIHTSFWVAVFKIYIERWLKIWKIICCYCERTLFKLMLTLPIFIVYAGICFLETFVSILYYGFPLSMFVLSTVRGYARYFRGTEINRSMLIVALLSILFPICVIYFVLMLIIIIIQSFVFAARVVFYLYLSVVIFPKSSFGYIYFLIMFFVYKVKIIHDFDSDYLDLFQHTIKASLKLEKQQKYGIDVEKHVITVPNKGFVDKSISKSKFGDLMVQNENQLYVLNVKQCPEYVKYKGQIPGVHKDLFEFIVNKCRPIHISVFHMVIQIVLVIFLVLTSILYVSNTMKNTKTFESSEVMNVMSVLLITFLPNVVRNFFRLHHSRKVRKRKVRQLVKEFWAQNNQ